MRPLTIVHVVHQFFPFHRHGTELVTYELARAQAEYGHSVVIFTGEFGRFSREIHIESGSYDGLPVYRAYFNPRVENGFLKHEGIRQAFTALLKDIDPDIIHFQHLKNLSLSLIAAARSMNIPTVMTLHDYSLICAREVLLRGDGFPCYGSDLETDCIECLAKSIPTPPRLKALAFLHAVRANWKQPRSYRLTASKAFSLMRKPNPLLRLQNREDFQLRNETVRSRLMEIDRIIVPGRDLGDRFRSYLELSDEKLEVIPNPVDVSTCRFRERVAESAPVRFGFVGKITRLKGVHLAVEAFSRQSPEESELHIYGAPTWTNISEISYYLEAREKGRLPHIHFYPHSFPRDQMGRVLDSFDLLLVPSICFESFGRVVVEAFAAGLPVVCSDEGGPSELVTDGFDGLHFRIGDLNSLVKVVNRLLESPGLIQEFSGNIKPPPRMSDQIARYEMMYRSML